MYHTHGYFCVSRKTPGLPLTTVKSRLQTPTRLVIGLGRVGAQGSGNPDGGLSWVPLVSSQVLPFFPKRDTGSFGWMGKACSDTANPRKGGTLIHAPLCLLSHYCFLASTRAPSTPLVASTCLPSKSFWKLFFLTPQSVF